MRVRTSGNIFSLVEYSNLSWEDCQEIFYRHLVTLMAQCPDSCIYYRRVGNKVYAQIGGPNETVKHVSMGWATWEKFIRKHPYPTMELQVDEPDERILREPVRIIPLPKRRKSETHNWKEEGF